MNDNTSFHVEEFRVMLVRRAVGDVLGTKVGLGIVGALVYLDDGEDVGWQEGCDVGKTTGCPVGLEEGWEDGRIDGR